MLNKENLVQADVQLDHYHKMKYISHQRNINRTNESLKQELAFFYYYTAATWRTIARRYRISTIYDDEFAYKIHRSQSCLILDIYT